MSALSLIVFLVVLASAASNFLTVTSPDLALTLNPLNTEARIYKLSRNLSKKPELAELADLQKMSLDGIQFNSIDARLYSLLGIIHKYRGNPEIAQRFFEHSLKLYPTEIQALIQRINFYALGGEYVKAVSLADILLRRWPFEWKRIAPYMPILLQDKAAYQEALVRFSKYWKGTSDLTFSLSKDVASTVIARRLIIQWHKQGNTTLRTPINRLTNKLVLFKQYLAARMLFLQTLGPSALKETGYVFNGNFNLETSGNLFDWKMPKQAGMSSKIRKLQSIIQGKTTSENVLELEFLDAPIKFSRVLQILILPSSKFSLKMAYSTSDLKVVNPIKLQLECQEKSKPIALLTFNSGTNEKTEIETSFQVPDADCNILRLRIYNGNFVNSWKNRYSGSLFLHSVKINLDGV